MKPASVDIDVAMPRAERQPWAWRMLLAAWLLVLLAWLGIISLAWNLAAFLLKFILRGASARRVGRAGIAYGYRFYWACARATGMMRSAAMRLRSLRSTRKRKPWKVKLCPTSGIERAS